MDGVPPSFQPLTFDVLPLDGVTATQTYDMAEGAWTTDSADGEYSPQIAAVVTLKTNRRGGSGRGRQYIGPLAEAGTDNGMLVGDFPDDLATAWQNFRDGLPEAQANHRLCVASYVLAEANVVTSINVSRVAATQRRRQDQLRH
jgi:hypothetical protein